MCGGPESLSSRTNGTRQVYSSVGLRNVADELETDAGPFPQLNPEFLVSANPDLIVINQCCGESPETVVARPGWESITAVQNGNVVLIDQDLSSRWGPRTVDFLAEVIDAVNEVAAS